MTGETDRAGSAGDASPRACADAGQAPVRAGHEGEKARGSVTAARYEDAPSNLKREAARRLRLVKRVAAYRATNSTTVAIGLVAGEANVSAATLKRYWSAVDGRPLAEWLPALVPAYKSRRPNPIPRGEAAQAMPGREGGTRYGRDDGPVPLWSPGAPLPVFAEIEGRQVALVDAGEHRALVALRDAVLHLTGSASPADLATRLRARRAGPAARRRAVRLSRIRKDAELAAFIAERIGTDDTARVRQAAIERFGVHRVPSKSAFFRFVTAQRDGASRG